MPFSPGQSDVTAFSNCSGSSVGKPLAHRSPARAGVLSGGTDDRDGEATRGARSRQEERG